MRCVLAPCYLTHLTPGASVFFKVLFALSESELQCSVRRNVGMGMGIFRFLFKSISIAQYLILPSQNYQSKFKVFKMSVSIPLQNIFVPQKIQNQPVQADKLYHLYDGTSES